MTYYVGTVPVTPYMEHFGILGMKWGVRRYQNPDGTLTSAGAKRYKPLGYRESLYEQNQRRNRKIERVSTGGMTRDRERNKAFQDRLMGKAPKTKNKINKAIAIGSGVAIAGALAYFGSKSSSKGTNKSDAIASYTEYLLNKNGKTLGL